MVARADDGTLSDSPGFWPVPRTSGRPGNAYGCDAIERIAAACCRVRNVVKLRRAWSVTGPTCAAAGNIFHGQRVLILVTPEYQDPRVLGLPDPLLAGD